jgi:type VI secretion system Hcp family effector
MALSFLTFLLVSATPCQGQNVGIGVENPTEKLQVGGMVHSVADGFRFPDGTVQTTANSDFEPQEAGDNRWIVILKCANPVIPGSFDFDTLQNVIKVIDYQWGMTLTPTGGAPELILDHIVIMKNIDASTTPLLHAALIGQYLGEMRLYFFRPLGEGMQLYYRITLNTVTIPAFNQKTVYKGGQDFAHLDILALKFEGATWFYHDGEVSNSTSYP